MKSSQWTLGFLLIALIGVFSFTTSALAQDHFMVPEHFSGQLPADSTVIHDYDGRVLVRVEESELDFSIRRHASRLENTAYLSYRAWRGRVAGHEPENLPDLDDSYILLALAGPMDRQWQAEIAASRLTIVDHVNPYGLLVRGDSDAVLQAARQIQTSHGHPVITHAMELPEASRTYRDFNEWLAGRHSLSDLGIRTRDGQGIVRLVFHNDADFIQTHNRVNDILQTGPEFSSAHNNAQYLATAGDLAAVLENIPEVAFAHGVFPRELHNNISAQEHLTNVQPVWTDLGYTGSGIIAGVNDNGLYLDHDDFPDGSVVATAGAMENTDSGHGTHVAGTVAGRGAAASPENTHECGDVTEPLPDARGMAWEAQLAHNNIFDGGVTEEAAMMEWQLQQGAVINNNSWGYGIFGSPVTTYDGETAVVDMAVRDADTSTSINEQMSIVFSAGNFGASGVSKPANAKNVITVGATQNDRCGSYIPSQCDGPDVGDMACFSSHGPSQGRVKPDIVAPGTDVLSTQSGDPQASWGGWEQPFWTGDDYEILPGTSMSSPMVTGAATVFYQYYQSTYGQLPSPALVKAALINNATDLGMDFPSNIQGWGRLDLRRAIEGPVEDGIVYYDQDDVDHLETGESWTTEIGVAGDEDPLKISLVWTDPPGASGCDPCHINDLDLVVTAPDGTIYRGNQFDGAWSEPDATGRDELNNVENVFIEAPMSGDWTVEINAFNVAENPSNLEGQDFALVATGDFGGISIEPPSAEVCRADDSFDYTIVLSGQFEGTTNLSFDDLPSGATGDFDPNPVVFPDEQSTFTVGGLTVVDGGAYAIEIFAVDDADPDNFADGTAQLVLYEDNPGTVNLLSPTDGSIDVDLQPEFSWDVPVEAAEYQFQLDTSNDFASPVIDEVLDETSLTPDDELPTGTDFYWRVRALNACGDGDWSDTFEFQTRFEPVADIGPDSFSFELTLGDSDSKILEIGNIGTGNLVWDIETDLPEGGVFLQSGHDPGLNEPIVIPEFTLEGSGDTAEFNIQAGDLTSGHVIGFAFEGEVTGVGGTGTWASDTCMVIEAPDGSTFGVGGFGTGTIPGCGGENSWDFGGSGSTDDGFYESEHPDVFDPPVEIDGEYTITFAQDYGSEDVTWSDVVVTLYKQPLPVCQDELTNVDWLSTAPTSGSTPAGDTDEVSVMVDTAGLNADDFEGYLCVTTNDVDTPLVQIQVELTVFDEDAGAVAGNVMSEGYCSDDPFPAAGATISVEGTSGNVFTTTADGSGHYDININENESPVDVTFSADGHLPVTVEGVNVIAGETTDVDADLPLDAPCATVDPQAFSETITVGSVEGFNLTLGNQDGAGELEWDIGIAESDCSSLGGVDWLSVDSGSGTVGAGDSGIVVVTADADDLQDGDYAALLCLTTNDSEASEFEVPFDLTVIDPSLGILEGTVTSQGVCTEDPGPLADALVTITGAENTFEVETDGDGSYELQISEDESPVDITVSADNHADGTESGVIIEGGEFTTVDFNLEVDAACADVTPDSIDETADLGQTVETSIAIENTGNQTLNWLISYSDGGGPSAAAQARALAAEAAQLAAEAAAEEGRGEVDIPTREDEELGIDPQTGEYSVTRGESLFQGAARDALIAEGVILMPDSGNDRIVALDPETGDIIDLNFIPEILDQGIPIQVILHPDNQRLLLTRQAGASGGVIESYDLDGEFLGIFAPQGGQDASIMQNIRGLAVHPVTETILVTVSGTNDTDPDNRDSVLEFGQGGEFLGHFIESGSGGLDGPWSIVFRNDDVVVSDSGTDMLRTYDWSGNFLEVFADEPNFPQQVFVHADEHVLAAGFSNPSGAWEWDADGDLIDHYDVQGSLRGIHELPGGTIIVTSAAGVFEIDRDNNLVRTITSDVNGRHLSFVQAGVACDPAPPGWLSVDPGSGSTDPGNTDTLDVTLDTDGLSPGEYSAQVCVESNDPINPVVPVDVTFTVELGDDFGVVDGEVFSQGFCGEDGFPADGADIEVAGVTETYTTTADENGFYQIQVPVADGPFDITASAPEHFPHTEEDVTVDPGGSITVDFDLEADSACIDVDPTELSATVTVGDSADETFEIANLGTQTLGWMIGTGSGVTRDESAPLIGFNFTTSGAGAADPQNWTRISDADGTVTNVPDDTGEATDVSLSWGGVTTDGLVFLGTDTLAGDAVPQHDYDLSGMTGYGFRSDGDFFIEVSGLEPNSVYEYWFVAYRGSGNIDNDVSVSEGDDLDAIEFKQFLDSGDNDGHFVINDVKGSDEQVWDELSFITESDSDGTITIHWEGDTQTTVIGAFAIRSALTCDLPDWLSVAPVSGSIDAGGADDTVTATLDADGLELGEYTASICVESNDPVNSLVAVPVTMTVTDQDPALLDVDPTDLAFGELNVGDAAMQSFTVSNAADPGAMSLELSALDLSGDGEFAITGGDCAVGTELEPGEDCSVEVTFTASSSGTFSGQVDVASTDGQADTVTLSGEGAADPAELGVSPTELDFGEVALGQSSAMSVTVSNVADPGAMSLELSALDLSGDAEFSLTGGDCAVGSELEPGESCTVEVSFEPVDEVASSGSLSVETADGQSQAVALDGEGVELPADIFQDRFEEL